MSLQTHRINSSGPGIVQIIKHSLDLLFEPGQVEELRILNTQYNTVSGYFTNMDRLAANAAEWSGKAPAIYATLNPTIPTLLARADNRVKRWAKITTSDEEILLRRWFPIDVDPARPAGISSTNEEHDQAVEIAKAIAEFLVGLGIPRDSIIVADSGNGAHVLVRIDLPNDTESKELLKRSIEAITIRFGTKDMIIDPGVFNAARIWKLYGTMACKGDNVPERPHRMSKIIFGEGSEICPPALLYGLSKLAPEKVKPNFNVTGSFDLETWMAQRGVEIRSQHPWNGGTMFVLDHCYFNDEHEHNGASWIARHSTGAVSAGCHHARCAGRGWHDLRDIVEPEWREKKNARRNSRTEQVDDDSSRSPTQPGVTILTLQPEALHGLAGEIVETILPYTEAHPVALLVYLLVGFGNIIAHNAHWMMERTKHHLNLFAALVGDTNRGRKGTSRSTPDYIFEKVDKSWRTNRVMSGLSSGQGLIWNVRDPITEHRPIKEKGKIVDYQDVVVDKGEEDKRLFIVEEEFSTVLKLAPVEGNILSAVIRQAWDSGNLRSLTSGRKSHPVKATDAHVTILGHITKMELLRYLDSTEQGNGFGNRFLWFVVERSKRIPNPKGTPDAILDPLIERLADSVSFAIKTGEISRDKGAEEVWTAAYDRLTEDGSGMVASMTARAAPQVMRLACIYALLDRSALIRVEHLMAALALWDYANESTKLIFGDSLGDPVADQILDAIKRSDGLDRTNLRDLFSRHNSAGIDQALAWLLKMDRIEEVIEATGGRPRTVYYPKRRQT